MNKKSAIAGSNFPPSKKETKAIYNSPLIGKTSHLFCSRENTKQTVKNIDIIKKGEQHNRLGKKDTLYALLRIIELS